MDNSCYFFLEYKSPHFLRRLANALRFGVQDFLDIGVQAQTFLGFIAFWSHFLSVIFIYNK